MYIDSSMTIIYCENGRKCKIEANNCLNQIFKNISIKGDFFGKSDIRLPW